jgi:hypothetical protein
MRFGAAGVYSRPGFGVATVGSASSGEPEHTKPQRILIGGCRGAKPATSVGQRAYAAAAHNTGAGNARSLRASTTRGRGGASKISKAGRWCTGEGRAPLAGWRPGPHRKSCKLHTLVPEAAASRTTRATHRGPPPAVDRLRQCTHPRIRRSQTIANCGHPTHDAGKIKGRQDNTKRCAPHGVQFSVLPPLLRGSRPMAWCV